MGPSALALRGLLAALLALTGCTVVPVQLPLALCPDRPPLVDEAGRLTAEGRAWLAVCLEAQRENCTAISILRGESPRQCDRGLR